MTPNRKRLLILGAGGFGREVLWAASEIPPDRRDWELAGFLDDSFPEARDRLKASGTSLPVLGTIREHQPAGEEVFLAAIGDPKTKLQCVQLLERRGARFTNIVHPSAHVAPSARLGRGILISFFAIVGVNTQLGDHVSLNTRAGIGHDAVLGDGCTISAFADVTGGVRLSTGAMLGSHAVVLPNSNVGAFATVGAGSVAFGTIPPGRTVFGVPARELTFHPEN